MPPTEQRGPRSRVSPGRLAAIYALMDVEEGAHADESLSRHAPLDPMDRGLAWNLCLGVLRGRPELDAVITQVARRPVWNLEPGVRTVLRVGLYELRHTRVPSHAAVDQAVEASRKIGVGHASGLINAVLRRQDSIVVPESLGHPDWIADRWRARYGSRADDWMRANNQPAPVHIVAKEDPSGVAREFQHQGITLIPLKNGVFRLPSQGGAIEKLPGYREGRWWVMDPSAVAIADLVPEGSEAVLDTCAAPGGKSFRMAAQGHTVFATDLTEERLLRMRQSAERLGLPMKVQVFDWNTGALPQRFPVVMVDAPCSSLGLLRRHPDIRWNRRESDLPAMVARQKNILHHAARCVDVGGCLIYAVCSPEPEEGELVAQSLKWPIEEVFSNAPSEDGADVFWGCRLRRPA